MGLIIVDTSVLIDNLRGDVEARGALVAGPEGGHTLGASLVTKVELLAGMRSHERRSTRDLLASLTWFAVDDYVAEIAGRLSRRYRASHQGIDVMDFVIAATVEHLGCELWTRNIKHFPMFPKLVPPC